MSPLLDSSRPSARSQSFQARRKRLRKHIGSYESAKVAYAYHHQAKIDSKINNEAEHVDNQPQNRRRHNHMTNPKSIDIVRRQSGYFKNARLPGAATDKPNHISRTPHRFSEPPSRKHP